MGWWKREAKDDAEQQNSDDGLPELESIGWYVHSEAVASTSFVTMLRRLPFLIGRALRIAWQASRLWTVTTIILNVIAGAVTTFGLLATRDAAVTLFSGPPSWDRVAAATPALITIGVAAAARSGLSIGAGWAQARLKPLTAQSVEAEFYDITTAVPASAYDEDDFGDDMQRSRQRGTQASVFLVEYTVNVMTGLIGVVAVGVALAVIHPVLPLLLTAAVLPVGWAAVRAARIQHASYLSRITRSRRLWLVEELMASRRTVLEARAYQMRNWLLDHHKWMVNAENQADFDVLNRQTIVRVVGSIAGGIATVAVYGALLWLLATGHVAPASGAVAVLALQTGTGNMQLLIRSINSCYEEGLYYSDHLDFLRRASERLPDPPAADAVVEAPQIIQLEDVGLRYPAARTDAVSGVTLTIRAGQTVALVGENGSGKSSLAKLIAGLYIPTAGCIRWDGTDTAHVDPDQLRRHVACVTQDFGHWPFSAEANIKIGRPGSLSDGNGHAGIEAAARAAGAHDMILTLPRQYQTLLDKQFRGGADLSGGQWQKMTLSRAVYRDSPVMLCDEPSSALDPRAEHQIFEYLKDRNGDRITILITHRLANIRHADLIVVLHQGRQVEAGTHDELMRLGGRYADLFTLQSSGYLDHTT